MRLKNKNILVYGIGKSGLATIEFLKQKKANIYCYDDNVKKFINGVVWIDENQNVDFLDFAVVSPGIYDTKLIHKLLQAGVEIINDIELASRFFKGKFIAITGTNGKSTTTALLEQILTFSGKKAVGCGNIGVPILSLYSIDTKNTYYILEISSFQLEKIKKFRPFIATVLNIEPDHLNRHKNLENYANIKFFITKNQKKNDFLILNNDNSFNFKTKAHVLYFKKDCHLVNDNIYFKEQYVLNKNDIKLLGDKNLENVLACVLISKLLEIENQVISNAVKNFYGLEHRLEFVAVKNDICFYNDSKATNVASTICALESFKDKNVILLLGGSDKGECYDPIFKYENISYIVCYGQTSNDIYNCALKNNFSNIEKADNLKDAYEKSLSKQGNVVLLSPACASYDEFSGFEERGRFFKELVGEKK